MSDIEYEVVEFTEKYWILTCPKCKWKGRIDKDQLEGKVSVICANPVCDQHFTEDFRKFLKKNA